MGRKTFNIISNAISSTDLLLSEVEIFGPVTEGGVFFVYNLLLPATRFTETAAPENVFDPAVFDSLEFAILSIGTARKNISFPLIYR